MSTIIIKNAVKKIRDNTVIDNASLTLEGGKIYGFVGRNGSGKTMLFRAISGLIHIDSGSIEIDGKVLHRDIDALPSVGIAIENAGLFPEFSGYKNLKILAGIKKKISNSEIRNVITAVGLNPDDKRPIRKYSLGMRQRILIAQAIMENPDVLLLDEPTNGLDDKGVEDIRKLIAAQAEHGAIVCVASHNKEDISYLSDKIFRVDSGRVTEE
jgi:ABC-2 type transport system ATP-binding protein